MKSEKLENNIALERAHQLKTREHIQFRSNKFNLYVDPCYGLHIFTKSPSHQTVTWEGCPSTAPTTRAGPSWPQEPVKSSNMNLF